MYLWALEIHSDKWLPEESLFVIFKKKNIDEW